MELTPVETKRFENLTLSFKRDDLYMPYPDLPVSGGKVRQLQKMVEANLEDIRTKYNNTIATYTSVHSPQSIITAAVAREYGMKCIIGVGGNIEGNHLLELCQQMGADVKVIAKIGYNVVLKARMKELQEQGNFFMVSFGLALEIGDDSVLTSIEEQCQNLPDELDNLVIPSGSCITASGILRGLKKYNKKVGTVYVVQIAGIDRVKDMLKYIKDPEVKFKFAKYGKYPYAKEVTPDFGYFELDPIYEGKAYQWMLDNKQLFEDSNTLFWVVGNTRPIRSFKWPTS